jgi:hypothetical protein
MPQTGKEQVSARSDDHKSKAAQFLELAQQIGDISSKAMLLEMAQRSIELADRVYREEASPAGK